MASVLDACALGQLAVQPVLLICNNPGADAIKLANNAGLNTKILNQQTHPDPDSLDLAILQALIEADCDLVLLSGYLKKIGPRVLHAFSDRILNIHPSLLPQYGGRGMYGMQVHRSVIAAGEKQSGVTIHLVNQEYDSGQILAQQSISVYPDDTPESLEQRIQQLEHHLLPVVLEQILRGKIQLPEKNKKTLNKPTPSAD
jgi:phosphoribosylglycinamide formyltransferase-1